MFDFYYSNWYVINLIQMHEDLDSALSIAVKDSLHINLVEQFGLFHTEVR